MATTQEMLARYNELLGLRDANGGQWTPQQATVEGREFANLLWQLQNAQSAGELGTLDNRFVPLGTEGASYSSAGQAAAQPGMLSGLAGTQRAVPGLSPGMYDAFTNVPAGTTGPASTMPASAVPPPPGINPNLPTLNGGGSGGAIGGAPTTVSPVPAPPSSTQPSSFGNAPVGTLSTLGTGQYPTGTGDDFGSLMQGWEAPFSPPASNLPNVPQNYFNFDPTQIANDPGYQFAQEQGMRGVINRAPVFNSGKTMQELSRFNQGLASQYMNDYFNRGLLENSTNYGRDVDQFNRAFGLDQTQYGRNLGEYQMAHDIFRQNQTERFNRLAALAGAGQTAAGTIGQNAGQYGSQAGGSFLGLGDILADLQTQAGNAQASGTVGSANSWMGLPQSFNNISDLLLWQSIFG